MTETASSATRKGKSAEEPPSQNSQTGQRTQPGGLTMNRIYTTAGVHPYDQVTWERRDVVMTNWRDGSVNFEQHGVEFPDFWSVNAANIVTTKYFRGAVGSPQREWSLKQLVDRVVGVYTETGTQSTAISPPKKTPRSSITNSSTPWSTRSSASTPRSGSTSAPPPRSRCPRVSSFPWTTPWTRSWSGTARRA